MLTLVSSRGEGSGPHDTQAEFMLGGSNMSVRRTQVICSAFKVIDD